MPVISEFSQLKAGDRVTIRTPQGQTVTGRAQLLLCNPRDGMVVLDLGGRHGRPGGCTPANFVVAYRRP